VLDVLHSGNSPRLPLAALLACCMTFQNALERSALRHPDPISASTTLQWAERRTRAADTHPSRRPVPGLSPCLSSGCLGLFRPIRAGQAILGAPAADPARNGASPHVSPPLGRLAPGRPVAELDRPNVLRAPASRRFPAGPGRSHAGGTRFFFSGAALPVLREEHPSTSFRCRGRARPPLTEARPPPASRLRRGPVRRASCAHVAAPRPRTGPRRPSSCGLMGTPGFTGGGGGQPRRGPPRVPAFDPARPRPGAHWQRTAGRGEGRC